MGFPPFLPSYQYEICGGTSYFLQRGQKKQNPIPGPFPVKNLGLFPGPPPLFFVSLCVKLCEVFPPYTYIHPTSVIRGGGSFSFSSRSRNQLFFLRTSISVPRQAAREPPVRFCTVGGRLRRSTRTEDEDGIRHVIRSGRYRGRRFNHINPTFFFFFAFPFPDSTLGPFVGSCGLSIFLHVQSGLFLLSSSFFPQSICRGGQKRGGTTHTAVSPRFFSFSSLSQLPSSSSSSSSLFCLLPLSFGRIFPPPPSLKRRGGGEQALVSDLYGTAGASSSSAGMRRRRKRRMWGGWCCRRKEKLFPPPPPCESSL